MSENQGPSTEHEKYIEVGQYISRIPREGQLDLCERWMRSQQKVCSDQWKDVLDTFTEWVHEDYAKGDLDADDYWSRMAPEGVFDSYMENLNDSGEDDRAGALPPLDHEFWDGIERREEINEFRKGMREFHALGEVPKK
jgi:hypothetical protein